MELRWLLRGLSIYILQVRVKEGPKGEDWWGEWKDVPYVREE